MKKCKYRHAPDTIEEIDERDEVDDGVQLCLVFFECGCQDYIWLAIPDDEDGEDRW